MIPVGAYRVTPAYMTAETGYVFKMADLLVGDMVKKLVVPPNKATFDTSIASAQAPIRGLWHQDGIGWCTAENVTGDGPVACIGDGPAFSVPIGAVADRIRGRRYRIWSCAPMISGPLPLAVVPAAEDETERGHRDGLFPGSGCRGMVSKPGKEGSSDPRGGFYRHWSVAFVIGPG